MASSRKTHRAEDARHPLEREARQCLRNERLRGRTLTVALSGGVDSVVLLDLLRRLGPEHGYRLRAVHVNHGLNRDAQRWEAFCRVHCRRRRIPFSSVRVQVAGEGANVEAQARVARYRALAEAGSGVIALAHHRDDQAETVLLQLLRGAGPRGLRAMLKARDGAFGADVAGGRPSQRLLRPLLDCSRAQIEAYARARRLRWVEDDSNADPRFGRNYLRREILPRLERRFPGASASLARASKHLAEASDLLDELARIDLASAADGARLSVARLTVLEPRRARNLLRYFLASHGVAAPPSIRLAEMLRQLCTARPDRQVRIALGTLCMRRTGNWVALGPMVPNEFDPTPLPWRGEAKLVLPGRGVLRARPVRGRGVSKRRLDASRVTVRARAGGERIRPDCARPRRTLKNLLQEARVPAWLRPRVPLVYAGSTLVWAHGAGVDCGYQACQDEIGIEFEWLYQLGQNSG